RLSATGDQSERVVEIPRIHVDLPHAERPAAAGGRDPAPVERRPRQEREEGAGPDWAEVVGLGVEEPLMAPDPARVHLLRHARWNIPPAIICPVDDSRRDTRLLIVGGDPDELVGLILEVEAHHSAPLAGSYFRGGSLGAGTFSRSRSFSASSSSPARCSVAPFPRSVSGRR